ncbi:hypothetical protein EMA8858_00521 [Emticicia aquatica]|uniref:Site-specific recombinase XerD n=1 Tax=Emticicia aquatica TaxID=1681835 RepID=A0ABN8ENI2_9BACT|nr:phage integrase SAM-like domain-containing protein [Emticicia aquatica]CAH0994412.1 hypothetical protein EMA8858_00521 [Emticicia aquatica]
MDNPFIINQVSYLQWIRRQSESKSGEVAVYITVTCNGQKAQFNSFVKGQEKQWNAKKKCFNGVENEPINAKLRLITSTLQQIELQLSASNQEVTAKTIIEAYKSKLESKVVKADKTPLFSKVLDAYLQRQNEYGSKHQTKKNHNTYRRHLIAFLKQSKKENIRCQDFDYDLAEEFKLFMFRNKSGNNHTSRVLGLVKRVLDFAIIKKYIPNNQLTALRLKFDERINTTSLDIEHLERLQNHTFTPRLEKIVDMFLFMCGTGIDHCDYARLTNDNYYLENGRHFIKQERQKSGSEADALMLNFAIKILDKYKSINDLPKCSLTELNRELKEAAKIVGIYIRLTSKIARKTYANHLANISGFSDENIAYFMGHKTTKHLKHYRKIKKNRVFNELSKIDNNLL